MSGARRALTLAGAYDGMRRPYGRVPAGEEEMLELDPSQLGTLELDGTWVPCLDLNGAAFVPTRVTLAAKEYAFSQSFNIKGHGAVMPQAVQALRDQGKQPLVIERNQRYYVFVTPP